MIFELEAAEFLVALPDTVPALAALKNRIHPDIAPEGSDVPRLVYQVVDESHPMRLDLGCGDKELVILIRIFAKTRQAASQFRGDLAHVLRGQRISLDGRSSVSDFAGYENGYDASTGDYSALALWRLS